MLPPGRIVMAAPGRISVAGEGDPLAVRRPLRPEETMRHVKVALDLGLVGQIGQRLGFKVEHPDVGLKPVARRDEGNLFAVRGEGRCVIHGWPDHQRLDTGSVDAGAINIRLPVAVALRGEHHPLAVGRDVGVILELAV